MPDLLETLRTSIADRYEIERELGRGGMATVYLARDRKHNREVAVKVLLPDLAVALGPERFQREIELATKLSHPHILPLYDSGEANGHLYYVMTYVKGESLRARLDRERQLPLTEALRIAGEVASALEHAHRHGIIHRDIKPENILLEDGMALVADFGIARAISAVGEQKLTQTGISLGTPSYMSPEQAMAERNLDGRTDVYSLGCVLYEMLAGSPPFTGPTAQAVIARHALDEVPSLTIVRGTIPDEVEDVVLCALAKVPADRFATAAEFAEALMACRQTATHRVTRGTKGVRLPTRANRRRGKSVNRRALVAGVVGGLLVAATGAWGAIQLFGDSPTTGASDPAGAHLRRIAILYFDDASREKRLGHIADGLTDALIAELQQVKALNVISANGVAPYRNADTPRDTIAKALDVGTVVEGTIDSARNVVSVEFRIIDGRSAGTWHRGRVEQPVVQIGDLPRMLADSVAAVLRRRLGNEVRLQQLRAGTDDAEAWSLVQQAEKLLKEAIELTRRGSVDSAAGWIAQADSLARLAERRDPKWGEPIVLLGTAAGRRERMTRDPAEASRLIDIGIAQADSALKLDPRNADALELRGAIRLRKIARGLIADPRLIDALVEQIEADMRAAVQIDPTKASALYVLSLLQYQKQNVFESYNLALQAYEADAYLAAAPEILFRLYTASYDLGQFPNAEHWCDVVTRRFPSHLNTARCRLWLMTTKSERAEPAEAWARAAKLDSVASPQTREYYAREGRIVAAAVIGRAGLLDSARRVLVNARAGSDIDARGELQGYEAFVRTLIGDREEAIQLLQRYLTDHPEHRRGFGKVRGWWWSDLENDPRFKALAPPGG